MFFTKSSF